ncbi:MAG: type II secretion system minor pseudopilin GspJ, partial [Pseudomonadota bacterium]
GHRNPARLPRSTLQRVAYEVEDEVLYRVQWLTLDRAQDSEPARVALLEQVIKLELRFLDTANEWRTVWPPLTATEDAGLPRAVEFSVELEDWGRVTRLVALTGA